MEGYATYQPQTTCRERARPGTKALAEWINRRFDGGTATASMRSCDSGGASEHKDGRATDWAMDASKKRPRKEVQRLLDRLLATDPEGNPHARGRRMGTMYVIWDDHSYASYRELEKPTTSACPARAPRSVRGPASSRPHAHLAEPSGWTWGGVTSWYAEPPLSRL